MKILKKTIALVFVLSAGSAAFALEADVESVNHSPIASEFFVVAKNEKNVVSKNYGVG